MAKLVCKYCGKDFIKVKNTSCNDSPNRKHVGLPNGVDCVYCGMNYLQRKNVSCSLSPSNKHQLEQ